ncbi:MAG: heme-binding domain-containing protein [Deltaproteobacteria bacterium]|nr:heme-binding domain-containing protein [Deltaproteobacteria bacterium]
MKRFLSFLILLSLFVYAGAYAHDDDDDDHDDDEPRRFSEQLSLSSQQIQEINRSYINEVKPIFMKKCMVCHNTKPDYPWYESIPGLGFIMRHHNEEGVEHIDFTNDFPFKGRKPLGELLEEFEEEVLLEDEMPPWYYLLTHWDARLTASEKKTIQKWFDQTNATLRIR